MYFVLSSYLRYWEYYNQFWKLINYVSCYMTCVYIFLKLGRRLSSFLLNVIFHFFHAHLKNFPDKKSVRDIMHRIKNALDGENIHTCMETSVQWSISQKSRSQRRETCLYIESEWLSPSTLIRNLTKNQYYWSGRSSDSIHYHIFFEGHNETINIFV